MTNEYLNNPPLIIVDKNNDNTYMYWAVGFALMVFLIMIIVIVRSNSSKNDSVIRGELDKIENSPRKVHKEE
jgi:hypothetical protein